MENQTLFKKRTFDFIDRFGHTHSFTAVVTQGMAELPTDYELLTDTKTVDVKVFNAVVNEVVMDEEGEFYYARSYDFPILCSRSDHANTFLREVQFVRSTQELFELVEDLRVDFNVAIDRDVRSASRKLVGLGIPLTNTNVPTRRKRELTPRRKPKYPYWGPGSGV